MRKCACIVLLLLLCVANVVGQSADSIRVMPQATHFIVIGDWGRKGNRHQVAVSKAMQEVASKVSVSFVVTTGDNFYPIGVKSIDDIHWKKSFELVYPVDKLPVSWYPVLGNHDYISNPKAEIEFTKKGTRWTMPNSYYTIHKSTPRGEGIDLVFIDTNPFIAGYYSNIAYKANIIKTDTAKQAVWIDSILSNDTSSAWKFVFGHHPMFSNGEHKGENKYMQHRFKAMFERTHVDAYFAGHEHFLTHSKEPTSRINYFISGAGSDLRKVSNKLPVDLFSLSTNGFMLVSVSEKETMVQIINKHCRVLYTYTINK